MSRVSSALFSRARSYIGNDRASKPLDLMPVFNPIFSEFLETED
jgi:hypothetical protein